MKRPTISGLSKIILLAVMGLFFCSLFFPMWRIELWAPQYPEGLVLQLYANKIGGDVDIINGLNHYIGMKTLHTENFPEFKILPYLIGLFGLFALLTGIVAKRKMLYGLVVSFMVFGVLAAVDFYRWNYQYGHDLDPNAAIRVPGMAYQPPLIGYKQLLNFGAYSIPDVGGWLLISIFILLFAAVTKESGLLVNFKKTKPIAALAVVLLTLSSCVSHEAVPIKLNSDNCEFCKMTISDAKCCAEAITDKGRVFKFDDIMCMKNYCDDNKQMKIAAFYVHDFATGTQLIPVEKAVFISGGLVSSPMNGGIIAFASYTEAEKSATALNANPISWQTILSK